MDFSKKNYYEIDLSFRALINDDLRDLRISILPDNINIDINARIPTIINTTTSLHGTIGAKLARYFKVYSGLSLNYSEESPDKLKNYLNFMRHTLTQNPAKNRTYWLGIYLGVEI